MQMTSLSLRLGERYQSFIEGQLAQGRYCSASEVVRAGLRLLEERDARLAALSRDPFFTPIADEATIAWTRFRFDAYSAGEGEAAPPDA